MESSSVLKLTQQLALHLNGATQQRKWFIARSPLGEILKKMRQYFKGDPLSWFCHREFIILRGDLN